MIRKAVREDTAAVAELASLLWQDHSAEELSREFDVLHTDPERAVFLALSDDKDTG